MQRPGTTDWLEANQHHLTAELAKVRGALEKHTRIKEKNNKVRRRAITRRAPNSATRSGSMRPPPALETLCQRFGLSEFERNTLLLCAGVELDSRFRSLCAGAQCDSSRPFVTWSLALAVLADAHWSALSPIAPLRWWRLLEVGHGQTLTNSPLSIDERVLHYLAGIPHLDERLSAIIEPVPVTDELVPSHRALASQIASSWASHAGPGPLPVAQLLGDDEMCKPSIASAACSALGLKLHQLSAAGIPLAPAELNAFQRIWEREAALMSSALLIDCGDLDPADAVRESAVSKWIESTSGGLILASRMRRRVQRRGILSFDVPKPTSSEQRDVWHQALGAQREKMNGRVDRLISQFDLSEAAIRSACAQAKGAESAPGSGLEWPAVWDACRAQARPRMDDLAQRIEPTAAWEDLILPEQQSQILREIGMHVRQRSKVYETWGFAGKCTRGLGISALFSGPSGTGKTMAAEVLARDLNLDLYKIDLSQAVSKYIGETEKNLRRIFDAAESGGAILLFDEADALFGKRSEVKDSHDRYANLEVSYLLQRMEAYRGLAILTTNLKNALDPAFQRRLRFVVQFPFPDASQRARIWKYIFPTATPTDNLDLNRLSRLHVSGGNIRNIALGAAFLAAEADEPVGMGHVLQSAQAEYAKLEKPLTESEAGGW